MLTTRELSALATDVAGVLPSSAQIRRPNGSSDGMGGRSTSFTTAQTVACRITPASTSEVEAIVGDKIRDGEPYRIAFPAGTDVRLRDRVVIGADTFSVEAVRTPRSVEVERVTYCARAAA